MNYLDNLNSEQRQAVEKIYGQVLVLAGPGTGKTHLLASRIAHILSETDTHSNNILCLTFTDSGAVEMRNRLARKDFIGEEAYKIKIATFHGFCQQIIDQNPQIFSRNNENKKIADDLDKALIFEQIIKSKHWEFFNSIHDDFAHKNDFLSTVSHLKRENFTPTKLQEILPKEKERLENSELCPENFYQRKFREFKAGDMKPSAKEKIDRKIKKLNEFCDLWEIYEQKLYSKNMYDYNDMINWVVAELQENENLKLDLQEKYQWILVDEYQDTNNSQNEILWALTDQVDEPNIFAVGDDDQSIYRFQGASLANMQDFREKFPNRTEITLKENYRSFQAILDVSYEVIKNNTNRANTEKSLLANRKNNLAKNIFQTEVESKWNEICFIADKIREKLESGTNPNEIAILVRKNREIEDLVRELPKFKIPVSAEMSKNILDNESVLQLIQMLKIHHNPRENLELFELMHAPFWEIQSTELLKISLKNRETKTYLVQTLLNLYEQKNEDDENLFSLNSENLDENIKNFFIFFLNSRKDFSHLRPAILTEEFLYKSGLAEFLSKEKKWENWQAIKKFVEWIREQKNTNLSEILAKIEIHQKLNIKISPDSLPTDKNSVQIMTAHKSKGKEFEVVFLPSLEDKNWGNPRGNFGISLPKIVEEKTVKNLDSENFTNEEERRLFFVALTRAKNEIYLSNSRKDFTNREKSPSMFLSEISENLLNKISPSKNLHEMIPIFMRGEEKFLTDKEKHILQTKTENFVWSATTLQEFLDCPKKFLWKRLIQVPSPPKIEPQLAFGTALHQTLEEFFREFSKTKNLDLKVLLQKFEYSLQGQSLDNHNFSKLKRTGEEILKNYFDKELQNIAEKHPFGFEIESNLGENKPKAENIRISGKIDKVVFLNAEKSRVKIVDYKSGKPNTAKLKMGESFWRQLVFYDILAKSSGKNWKIDSCAIEWLQPNSKNEFEGREIKVSEEDRQKVLEELKDCNEKILSLDFANKNPQSEKNVFLRKEIEFWQNFGK